MTKTLADILIKFVEAERSVLDSVTVKHGPTIGDMYEGLTKETLEKAIPEQLNLKVVSGFVCYDGTDSGEIDCMLVSGEGDRIPKTDKYRWDIKNVIAVFEVKKQLTASQIAESYNHLHKVSTMFYNYSMSDAFSSESINIKAPRRAFSLMTGIDAPEHQKVAEMGKQLEMMYHALLYEYISPIRIVVGYHSFEKEKTIRDNMYKFIQSRLTKPEGLGVVGFPQLIIAGSYSLVKANGCPYSPQLEDGKWPFLLSTSHNPLRILIELLFTKIDMFYGTDLARDDSTEQEAMSVCFYANYAEQNGVAGWKYEYKDISARALKQRGASYAWEPVRVSVSQAVVLTQITTHGRVDISKENFMTFAKKEAGTVDAFVDGLLATRLVAKSGRWLSSLSDKLVTAALPDGDFVASNNGELLSQWVIEQGKKRK